MDLLGSILNNMDAPPAAKIDKETQKKVKGKKQNLGLLSLRPRSTQDSIHRSHSKIAKREIGHYISYCKHYKWLYHEIGPEK